MIIETMLKAAIAASEVILEVYARPFTAESKTDGSPVTEADHRAEAVILDLLAPLGIPVLGEESVAAGQIPELGHQFFVVDPLDGTKEFLKRNGEFTVNIALTEAGRPVSGVVLAPVTGDIFWTASDGAMAGRVVDGAVTAARRIAVDGTPPLRIVASRSHGHPALAALCDTLNVAEDVSVGSSLKFCLLADGKAQLYPRFTPTSEWDTAAGQAVLEAAGGVVLNLDGRPLSCGHPERKFLNGFFVAAASQDLAQRALAEMQRLLA
ncbi:MAG TPA: 3'(2'),5'-bisphosphate nucleotidase CysQ [Devosia sp.]